LNLRYIRPDIGRNAIPLRLTALLVASLALAQMQPAAAQAAYPTKTVALVSTAPAGGSIDTVARIVASELTEALGRPVIVDTKPGAGGNIAAGFVAKSEPDGHTLLISASSTLAINPHIYRSLPFDPEASFVPVIMPAAQNLILVVHPKLNVTSVAQLIALLKAQPGKLNYASGGTGNLQHLGGEIFNFQTGTQANHIPYKGAAPALTDMLAGQTDYMFDSSTSIPHVKSGKLIALAVVGPNKVAELPQVATFRELGMPWMEAARGYYVIMAPAGTPAAIVLELNRHIAAALKKPANAAKISAQGLDPVTSSPQELGAALREDRARFADVVRKAAISPQ
jgi:tripartite-type tricarboxylate transporter receptor subunit TctC